jgi:sulfur-oxidizing protein SoxY
MGFRLMVFAWMLFGFASVCGADDTQPASSMWEFLRTKYYGDTPMGLVDESYLSLEVPANTPDPAATPLTLHFADGAHIKRARVFIDNNPSPLVATLEFGDTPVTQIDLHVRIDRFTSVRVVAEKADGGLEMRSAWVKASGGCSAPPSAAAGGTLGEVRLRSGEDAKSLLVSIRHPNSSGFQIDPRTGDNIPAHYISDIRIEAGGRPVLDAQTGISVSENPTLRIASDQSLPGPVTVDAVDSVTQAHFTATTSRPRIAAQVPAPANGPN